MKVIIQIIVIAGFARELVSQGVSFNGISRPAALMLNRNFRYRNENLITSARARVLREKGASQPKAKSYQKGQNNDMAAPINIPIQVIPNVIKSSVEVYALKQHVRGTGGKTACRFQVKAR